MHVRTATIGWAVAALAVAGCASAPQKKTVSPIPYRVQLAFESELPDPFPVTAGPISSYRRVRFNDRARSALQAYAAAKSAPDARQTLELAVRLTGLETRYDQLGARGPRPEPVQVAMLGRGPLGFMAWEGGQQSLPDEIHKTAVLTAAVRIAAPGRDAVDQTVTVERTEVLRWEEYDGSEYDYRPVLDRVVADLVGRVDALVARAAGGG